MDTQLRLKHGEVAVKIQHSAVVVSKEAEARILQHPLDPGSAHPLLDLRPRTYGRRRGSRRLVRHCALRRLLQPQQAVHDADGDPGAFKGVCGLGHRTADALRQPFAGIGPFIVHLHGGLEIENDDRRLADLVDRQHGRAGKIRSAVHQDQIDVVRVEVFAGLAGLLLVVHQSEVKNLGPLRYLLLDKMIVAENAVVKSQKLIPVRAQTGGIQADARARCLFELHETSLPFQFLSFS